MKAAITRIIDKLSEGNIGCASMLCSILKEVGPLEFFLVADALETNGIRGDRAYMLWNDACGRNTRETVKLIMEISRGIIPMATVNAHLAEGRCAPFTDADRHLDRVVFRKGERA